jgi:putative nucleotidyltransferase with HDIG domain
MGETVLFVDDEENILNALRRVFADSGLDARFICNPLEALNICRNETVSLVVSDNMMPEMQGIEFLSQLRDVSPDTVKILMTAHADLSTALQAINSGEVFRFIVKPWQESELVKGVGEGLARYRVLSTLKLEDEAVLKSLAQTIELKDQYTRGHCDRVAGYALMIAGQLGLAEPVCRDIRHGSWLHDCGKIGVPEAILNSSEKLNEQDFSTIRQHPEWGATVAEQAKLPVTVINIIRYHHEHYDGSGYPSGLSGEMIPLEARVVSVADVYDALTTDRPYKAAFDVSDARKIVAGLSGRTLDPYLVDLFLKMQEDENIQNEYEVHQ